MMMTMISILAALLVYAAGAGITAGLSRRFGDRLAERCFLFEGNDPWANGIFWPGIVIGALAGLVLVPLGFAVYKLATTLSKAVSR